MENRKLDLKVGQKVAVVIEKGSNAYNYVKTMTLENIDKWCFEGEVIKVGSKYISVVFKSGYNDKDKEIFVVDDDYRQKYASGGANFKLYPNKDYVIQKYKTDSLFDEIQSYFQNSSGSLTLTQLEKIKEIIKEVDFSKER